MVRARAPRRAVPRLGDAAVRQRSRRTRISCRSASRRSTASPPATATSPSCRRPPRSSASRRRRTSPATRSSSSRAPASTATRLRAQLATAGYSHVTQVVAPGEYCVRGGLIDLFPMGSALPYRIDLADERDRVAPHLRRRHAAHGLQGERRCACCRRASSRWTTRRARASARASARRSRATRRRAPSTRTSRTASRRPGIEYYLPLFFDGTGHALRLPAGRARRWSLHHDVHAAIEEFWRDAQLALPAAARRPRPAAAPARGRCSSPPSSSSSPRSAFARLDLHAPQLARDDADWLAATPRRRGRGRAPRRRSAARAQGLPRDDARARPRARRVARPARDDDRVPRRVRPAPAPCARARRVPGLRRRASCSAWDRSSTASSPPPKRWNALGLRPPVSRSSPRAELYAGTARARAGREQAKR